MRKVTLFCIISLIPNGLCGQRTPVTAGPAHTQKASPQELSARLSPSVLAVQILDTNNSVIGIGSGVVVAPNEVVTNRHVIDSGRIWRLKQGDKTWRASVTWVDPDHDLGLLRAEGLIVPAVSLRVSPTIAVGERVYAIGTPEGLELTLSEGIVSGLREYEDDYIIQTSTPISPGSSGGDLFDEEGRLAGITSFGLVEGQNLNFALPAGWVQALLGVLPLRHREPPVSQLQPAKEYEDTATRAEILISNIITFELSGVLPLSTSHMGSAASTCYANAVVRCIFDEKSPDCIHNWPLWQRASLMMFRLRAEYQALQTSRDNLGRSFVESIRSEWSDVSDAYCQDRPGGLYTDLEGKIRACPNTHRVQQ